MRDFLQRRGDGLSMVSRSPVSVLAILLGVCLPWVLASTAAGTDPCDATVAVGPIGPRVHVIRGGVALLHPKTLRRGDAIGMGTRGQLVLRWSANRYALRGADASLGCDSVPVGREGIRALTLRLQSGAVTVHDAAGPAAVVTPEVVVIASRGHTSFAVHRAFDSKAHARTTAATLDRAENAGSGSQRAGVAPVRHQGPTARSARMGAARLTASA